MPWLVLEVWDESVVRLGSPAGSAGQAACLVEELAGGQRGVAPLRKSKGGQSNCPAAAIVRLGWAGVNGATRSGKCRPQSPELVSWLSRINPVNAPTARDVDGSIRPQVDAEGID
jgi:hypothetical protein